jgi:hypothetical protein
VRRRHAVDNSDPLGGATLGSELDSVLRRSRGTGRPLAAADAASFDAGFERDLSAVRIHTGPEADHLCAQVEATAFTVGSDLYFGHGTYQPNSPQGRQLLAHELAHVVQGGSGPATGAHTVGCADDPAERHADQLATAALNRAGVPAPADTPKPAPPATAGSVIRRVKGGIEFTEGASMLWAYDDQPFAANVAAYRTFSVGAQQMTGFRIGAGQGFEVDNATLGAPTNEDLDVATASPNVKLTNDVESPEWIIERHHVDVPVDTMRRNLKADLGVMFDARKQLADSVNSLKTGHADEVAIAPGNVADTNAAPEVFIYDPGANRGRAQITAMYTSEDTIRRINKLNVSKYLTGTKVAEGEDLPRISGTASQTLINADIAGTTSFSTAEHLLTGLRGASLAIPLTVGGGDRLSQAQVGIVKLMVLNDALATTMERYAALVGQGAAKNSQRFFPKSRRDEYVKAIAQADLDAAEMTALENEIVRTSAADALLLFNSADPTALRTDQAFTGLPFDAAMVGMMNAKQQAADPTRGIVPNPAALLLIKTTVLGANGALLATWITRAAHAYTDLTAAATQHTFVLGLQTVGSVIETSRGFTPLAPGDRGAIYEMREREVGIDKSGWFNVGSQDEITKAIDTIFGAA